MKVHSFNMAGKLVTGYGPKITHSSCIYALIKT